jgi:hypothetical protein
VQIKIKKEDFDGLISNLSDFCIVLQNSAGKIVNHLFQMLQTVSVKAEIPNSASNELLLTHLSFSLFIDKLNKATPMKHPHHGTPNKKEAKIKTNNTPISQVVISKVKPFILAALLARGGANGVNAQNNVQNAIVSPGDTLENGSIINQP